MLNHRDSHQRRDEPAQKGEMWPHIHKHNSHAKAADQLNNYQYNQNRGQFRDPTWTNRTSNAGLVLGSRANWSNFLCMRTSCAFSIFTSKAYLQQQPKKNGICLKISSSYLTFFSIKLIVSHKIIQILIIFPNCVQVKLKINKKRIHNILLLNLFPDYDNLLIIVHNIQKYIYI